MYLEFCKKYGKVNYYYKENKSFECKEGENVLIGKV